MYKCIVLVYVYCLCVICWCIVERGMYALLIGNVNVRSVVNGGGLGA